MEGELKNRSGVKVEEYKGKHQVSSWPVEAHSWTVESNFQLPFEEKFMTVESKRKSLSLEVTNWPVEAKCSNVESTPITTFPRQHSISHLNF